MGAGEMMRRVLLLCAALLLLLAAPAAALDGYDYYQTIDYNATDVSSYQQDLVIHRTAGTDYTLCDGLTVAASGLTSQSVTLSGSTPYSEVWIALGTAPGNYGYQSAIISTNTSSYTATIESFPLVAGETFYARAGCGGGYSSEVSFTLPSVTPRPRTTYGDRFNTLMSGNLSIPAFWEAEADTYGDQFGGGDFGVMVFVSLLSALVFIVLFLRSGDVVIPFMVGGLIAGVIIPHILPEFAEMGYAFAAAALIGIGYSLYRRYV
ncbi:hypothetical protein J2129_002755 [Methanofollis sp. W23]|uniref:hypothetical protein n=1 Tax=Methanofollis sp. W23 TaxID=2817849 RepID=UPI001AE339AD|nr:hypothetical protein [Methanofollis sp. W23]MBP2147242.1 hypothetical protein [Methanofollis sp. W23]